ncbi:MAG: DUF669 domain-containing protein [Pyrinomonadaceae bacterium]|nr:DUF669 domain-containing protein [Phycisphaerales bacterium]
MASIGTFNAGEVAPIDHQPIPAGQYGAAVIATEWKDARSGGRYLLVTVEIIQGPHAGRHVWAMLNLENANAKAVTMARGELSAICRAAGVMKPADTAELHDIPMQVTVGVRRRSDTGDLANIILSYAKKPASPGTTAREPAAPPQQGSASGSQQPDDKPAPWERT